MHEGLADGDCSDGDDGNAVEQEHVVQPLKFSKNTPVLKLRVLLRDSLKDRWCTSGFHRIVLGTHYSIDHAGRKDKISWKDISQHSANYCNSSVLPPFWNFGDPTQFNQKTLLSMLEYLKDGDDGNLTEQRRFKWYTTPRPRPTAATSQAVGTRPPTIAEGSPTSVSTFPVLKADIDITTAPADTAPSPAAPTTSNINATAFTSTSTNSPTTSTKATLTTANATPTTSMDPTSYKYSLALAVDATEMNLRHWKPSNDPNWDGLRDLRSRQYFASPAGQHALARVLHHASTHDFDADDEEADAEVIAIKQECVDPVIPAITSTDTTSTDTTPAPAPSAPALALAMKGGKKTKAISSGMGEELVPVTSGKRGKGNGVVKSQQPASEARPTRQSARPKRKTRGEETDVQVEAEVMNKRRRGA